MQKQMNFERKSCPVKLVTNDEIKIEASHEAIRLSPYLTNLVIYFRMSEIAIPVPNVSGPVLKKVLEWAEHHKYDSSLPRTSFLESRKIRSNEISQWDSEFMKVDRKMLFELITASNFLEIKGLYALGYKVLDNIRSNKPPSKIIESTVL